MPRIPQSVTRTGVDMTGTVDFVLPFGGEYTDGSIQVTWTGTPTGTFSVAASNTSNGTTDEWQTLTVTGLTNPAGAAGGNLLNIVDLMTTAVRLRYVHTGGSGTMQFHGIMKGR